MKKKRKNIKNEKEKRAPKKIKYYIENVEINETAFALIINYFEKSVVCEIFHFAHFYRFIEAKRIYVSSTF